jgi:hypothetical protein
MDIQIHAPRPEDAEEVLAFEMRNRAWFESVIYGELEQSRGQTTWVRSAR